MDLVSLSAAILGALLIALLFQASRNGLSCLDLITDKGSKKISLTKTMNLLGGCVGGWVVMRLAIHGSLDWTLFGIYLAYCGGTHGFSTWLSARFNFPIAGASQAPRAEGQ